MERGERALRLVSGLTTVTKMPNVALSSGSKHVRCCNGVDRMARSDFRNGRSYWVKYSLGCGRSDRRTNHLASRSAFPKSLEARTQTRSKPAAVVEGHSAYVDKGGCIVAVGRSVTTPSLI